MDKPVRELSCQGDERASSLLAAFFIDIPFGNLGAVFIASVSNRVRLNESDLITH